jgi:beta-glucosidase
VHLEPGESKEISFTLTPRELHLFDATMRFIVEPGTFRVLVGGSSKDIRLRGDLVVK